MEQISHQPGDVKRGSDRAFGDSFDWQNKLLFSEHHLSHAASAFFPSPYDEAVVLTMDGVGEWATTSVAIRRGGLAMGSSGRSPRPTAPRYRPSAPAGFRPAA
jgi:predicted NodU family carbamoyl transferase